MTLLQVLMASAQADEARQAEVFRAQQVAAQTRGLSTLRGLLPDDIWTALNVDWYKTAYGSDGTAEATGVVEIGGSDVCWYAKCHYSSGLKIGCRDLNLWEETGRGEENQTTVSRFLLNASRSIQKQRDDRRSARLVSIERQFGWKLTGEIDAPAFLAMRDEAIALAPDQAEKFHGLYDSWLLRYEQYQAELVAQAELDANRKADEEAFIEKKADWFRRAKAIVDHNDAVTAKYQPLADVAADLRLLTYALAGDNSEGGLAVETREVYCYPKSKAARYPENEITTWPVVGPGPEFAPQWTVYFYPVSYREVSVKPSAKVWPVYYTSEHLGQRLVIGPATPAGLVEQWKAELRTIDASSMPYYPEHFSASYGLRDSADQRAMALADYSPDYDDMYF